jgi:hypothetical protein
MAGKPVPKGSILERFVSLKAIGGQKRWQSNQGDRLYTWDSLHGEVEVYNRRGRHLGALDPMTGKVIKEAKRGRTIDV